MKTTAGKRGVRAAKPSTLQGRTYHWPVAPTPPRRPHVPPHDQPHVPPSPPHEQPHVPPPPHDRPHVPPPHRRPHDEAPRKPENGKEGHLPQPPAHCTGALHRVRPGDTLFRLSMKYGVDLDAIVAANPQVTDPDMLLPGQILCIPEPVESMLEILNALLTAEKIEAAMYARGLVSPALAGLDADDFAYFQAGLSAEISHIEALRGLGASVPYREFFFPPGAFEDRSIFVNTLLTLETAGVAAYIQASAEFARMGRFDLSRLMDQIMGVEAEHRVLLRDVLGLVPANDLCFERAPNQPVTEILAALPMFLQPNQFNGASTGPVPLPTPQEAEALIGPFGCPNPRPDL